MNVDLHRRQDACGRAEEADRYLTTDDILLAQHGLPVAADHGARPFAELPFVCDDGVGRDPLRGAFVQRLDDRRHAEVLGQRLVANAHDDPKWCSHAHGTHDCLGQ